MTNSNRLDNFILATFALLAALPFGNFLVINLGFVIVDATEMLLAFLSALLFVAIYTRGARKSGFNLFLATIFVFSSYALISIFFINVALTDVIQQLRRFFPFLVASMVLATTLRGNILRYLNVIVVSIVK